MNPAPWLLAGLCIGLAIPLLVSMAIVRYLVQHAGTEPGETIVIEGHYCESDKL
jgi:hypothetical protein